MKSYFKHPFPYIAAILIAAFYWSLPLIAKWMTSHVEYVAYAQRDAHKIVDYLQKGLWYPFGKILPELWRALLIFPYWLAIFLLLRAIFLHTKKLWKYAALALIAILLFLYVFPDTLLFLDNNKPSIAHGELRNGWLENGKRMNYRGKNFTTYSFLGYLFGRTYVHSEVKKVLLDAYEMCEKTCPEVTFVVGEIGFKKGGEFLPHRTHENGLSVDLMTPLLKNGKHYTTHHIFNIWAYGMEFDNKGKFGTIEVDYETMAQHLYAIKVAARRNKVGIRRIIFDPVLRAYLEKTSHWHKIKDLPFTRNRVILRHDDHYHIDFEAG